ncbi:MAG: type II toxin-antitoxin system RelE/ParE family toxin, partial [Rhodospirillaceae bacterium]
MPYKLTYAAQADLRAILRFTANRWGKQQSKSYSVLFSKMFARLSDDPTVPISRIHHDLPSECRTVLVGSHIVVYRLNEGEVQILRI